MDTLNERKWTWQLSDQRWRSQWVLSINFRRQDCVYLGQRRRRHNWNRPKHLPKISCARTIFPPQNMPVLTNMTPRAALCDPSENLWLLRRMAWPPGKV